MLFVRSLRRALKKMIDDGFVALGRGGPGDPHRYGVDPIGRELHLTRLDRLARSTRDLLNMVAKAGAGFRSLADAGGQLRPSRTTN